ncbi:MAG: hypothetical protein JWO78_2280 [Micavibrio sp.]|nr:hypothetical protein [Micavibrio sp.]
MAFFTKAEIKQRMIEKRKESPRNRADLNMALIILGSGLFEKRLWSDRDYGEHPLSVGLMNTRSLAKIIIGVLHDIVEDSDWTIEDLRQVGFSERVLSGVNAMTKPDDELYFDFIERCSLNKDATDKKIDDISHNLDLSRSDRLFDPVKDGERVNKYIVSKAYLVAVKKGRIEAGSSMVDFINSRDDFKNDVRVKFLVSQHSSHSAKPANDFVAPLPGTGTTPSP